MKLQRSWMAFLLGALASVQCIVASAQIVCTTQAAMAPDQRQSIAKVAMSLATAVKADNVTEMRGMTVEALAGSFAEVEYTVGNVSGKLDGDSMRVTQVYLLDASKLKVGNEADFSCDLNGSTSETDFSINGLMPGMYSFVMVEAEGGPRPWLLSFLLQKEAGEWRMAGLYEHPRTAAGKDGLAYWNLARKQRSTQPWLAWLSYSEAMTLLSPAPFVSSTNLDKLRAEQHQYAPPALAVGVTHDSPLVVKLVNGSAVRIVSLGSDTTADGLTLRLVMHYAVTAGSDAQAQDVAAVKALLDAHPELRVAFGAVLVFGEIPGQNPSVLTAKMAELPS